MNIPILRKQIKHGNEIKKWRNDYKMVNVCFLIGKIVSEIEFDFILKSRNISIVNFLLELNNKTVVSVKGYNEIADFCYSKLDIGDYIIVYGRMNSKMEIIIEEIILLDLPNLPEGRSFW